MENRPTEARHRPWFRNGLSRANKGLGDPTPTKDHAFVHPLDYLVAMKCQQNLATGDIYVGIFYV